MANKQSKRARREAARRAHQRRQRITWSAIIGATIVAISAIVFIGGSGNQAAALAPDFTLDRSDGDTVTLSDYRGRPVAVTFMHTY